MDQPPLPDIDPYVNRNLFSDHFLEELLPQDESWQADEDRLKLAMQGARLLAMEEVNIVVPFARWTEVVEDQYEP